MMLLELLRSSTFRLAISYMALFVGSVLLLLAFLYWSSVAFMAIQTDKAINAELTSLAEIYEKNGISALKGSVEKRASDYERANSVYALVRSGNRMQAGNLQGIPQPGQEDGWQNFTYGDNAGGGRVMQVHGRSVNLDDDVQLFVGRDVRASMALQQVNVRALLWGLLVMVLLGLLGGLIMSRRVLRHIEGINQTTREIMAGDINLRIATRGTSDDFDQLAANLNAMLDEIVRLMDGVRHVSNSVAHDLRTPLTRLRNQLESLAGSLGEDSPYSEKLAASVADADQLLATFGSLLRIARIEAGGMKKNLEVVSLAALLRDAMELYEAVAEAKDIGLQINAEEETCILGDRDMLFQALTNLLDNAIKYTQAGGVVELSATQSGGAVGIMIADNGPGIPGMDYGRLVERFYRGDQSRGTEGSGLGLSLVEAVVSAHKGSLQFSDNKPGLKVKLDFKSAAIPCAN